MFRKGFLTSTSWVVNGDGFAVGNNAEGADFLAKILYTCLGDGAASVTTTGFQVVKKTGLICTVKPFFVAKSGYFAWDTAETDITFTSSASEQVIYVGVRLDLANNTFVNGVAGRTTFVSATDLVAAKITIPANAVTLTDAMIEDLRYNTTYCGQIDEYRERSLALIADLEDALAALAAGSVLAHATNHLVGGSDPIPYPINLIINANFGINQRAKSGTVTLAAGVYGHDRWKAGASGCTYTLATSENVTTLTISAGSLVQVVEGLNLQSGTVCLSWTGTAQGKIGAGSYSASGVTGTATGGTNLNIEFNTGTLSKVQLNYGSVALPFVPIPIEIERLRCHRYYLSVSGQFNGYAFNTTANIKIPTSVQMRTNPTAAVSGELMLVNVIASFSTVTASASENSVGLALTLGSSSGAAVANLNAASVTLDAEL